MRFLPDIFRWKIFWRIFQFCPARMRSNQQMEENFILPVQAGFLCSMYCKHTRTTRNQVSTWYFSMKSISADFPILPGTYTVEPTNGWKFQYFNVGLFSRFYVSQTLKIYLKWVFYMILCDKKNFLAEFPILPGTYEIEPTNGQKFQHFNTGLFSRFHVLQTHQNYLK